MYPRINTNKRQEWLRRYVPAEVLATALALVAAWATYEHTHSFVAAAASGWVGEGIGFYGYFISVELLAGSQRYAGAPVMKRLRLAIVSASTNLLVEFVPAEILDNFIIRPYLMYRVPQLIHPYPLGFLAGKFGADIIFYGMAIIGYEARKRWIK